jgi:hypothetical protein
LHVIDEVVFRGWLADGGIENHAEVEHVDYLCFKEGMAFDRFWFPSFVPSDLHGFISTAVSALSAHGPYYLMRCYGGAWYSDPESATLDDLMLNDTLKCNGVPAEASGALCFQESDWRAFVSIVLSFYIHGWCVDEDLYIFGEERNAILKTSHHGQLYGRFPSEERMELFRKEMLSSGYDLPIPPGETRFQCPAWLKGPVHHGPA